MLDHAGQQELWRHLAATTRTLPNFPNWVICAHAAVSSASQLVSMRPNGHHSTSIKFFHYKLSLFTNPNYKRDTPNYKCPVAKLNMLSTTYNLAWWWSTRDFHTNLVSSLLFDWDTKHVSTHPHWQSQLDKRKKKKPQGKQTPNNSHLKHFKTATPQK